MKQIEMAGVAKLGILTNFNIMRYFWPCGPRIKHKIVEIPLFQRVLSIFCPDFVNQFVFGPDSNPGYSEFIY